MQVTREKSGEVSSGFGCVRGGDKGKVMSKEGRDWRIRLLEKWAGHVVGRSRSRVRGRAVVGASTDAFERMSGRETTTRDRVADPGTRSGERAIEVFFCGGICER